MINCLRRTDPVFLAFYLEMPLKNFFLGYRQTLPNHLCDRYLGRVRFGLFSCLRFTLGLGRIFKLIQLALNVSYNRA